MEPQHPKVTTDTYGVAALGPGAPPPLISGTTLLSPAEVGRRRMLTLGVFSGLAAVAAALGYTPWEVPAIVLAWLGGTWIATRAAARVSAGRALNIMTASFCLNTALLTWVCYYLGGATWLAGTFYLFIMVVAGASLPRNRALLVAGVALLGFAFLALAPILGAITLPRVAAVAQGTGRLPRAVFAVVVQGAALGLVVLLQQSLVGALRSAALSSRTLIEAATDLVAVVDRQGVIHRTNAAFTAHTAEHLLHGANLFDIVTDDHRGYLELKLAQAGDGSRVAFELSYRGGAGSHGWLAGTLVPLPEEDSAARILLIARDVTLEHEAAADNVISLARQAAGLRTKTFARAIGDLMREVEASLDAISERAIALRGNLQLQEHATMADDIASEAARLRDSARDASEWLNTARGRQAS